MQEGWYLDREGERLGPFLWEQMVRFAEEGRLAPSDQVWHPGDQRWHDAGQLPGLIKAPPPGPPAGSAEKRGPAGPDSRRL